MGHWYNFVEQSEAPPVMFWSEALSTDVVYEMNGFQSEVLSHFKDIEDIMAYEDYLKQITDQEELNETKEFFEESIPKQC